MQQNISTQGTALQVVPTPAQKLCFLWLNDLYEALDVS